MDSAVGYESPPSEVWLPRLGGSDRPAYLAIVEALADDLNAGRVAKGAQLLPQRDMARRLRLSVGTVAKAYAEAARRGLIAGEVGRGTYVSAGSQPASAAGTVDMSLNAPPDTGASLAIAQALAAVARSGEVGGLIDYLPHPGLPAHRSVVAGWLREELGLSLEADRLVLCNGAQHGISLALMAALRPGDAVLAEALTYPGIRGITSRLGHALHAVAIDREGIIPEALAAAFVVTGAKALYCMPTLQTPTGAIMSERRRRDVVEVLRCANAWAIEDDVYAFLAPDARPSLAELAPERVFYITTFAKCVAPGLRVGAVVVPDLLRTGVNAALRGTGWMASPLLTAVAVQMISTGTVNQQIVAKRAAAASRWQLAHDILGPHAPPSATPAFHLWLPAAGDPRDILPAAAMRGVVLAEPTMAEAGMSTMGLRLCLGAPEGLEQLRHGLEVVRSIMTSGGGRSLV